MDSLHWSTASDLARGYREGSFSPVDAVEASLARLQEVEPSINSMVTITGELALEQARLAEMALRDGDDPSPLLGIPITVKDLCETAGVRTTYGARSSAEHVPDVDAISWDRLRRTGVLLLGKTTTPEYGLLGITVSRLTGATSTPWLAGHNAGGSSGGAAAGVAAGVVPVAWGSDGGGSIRVPAALCGVVGIKPSVGRVPFAGQIDPDDTEGPIARTVHDAALLLDATVGRHPRDRFSLPHTGEVFASHAAREGDLRGMRIAACADPGAGRLEPAVEEAFHAALDDLRALGAEVSLVDLRLPDANDYFVAYWGPDYATYVDEMDAAGDEVWPMVRDLADAGRLLTGAQASAAMRDRKTDLYEQYAAVFESHDVLVTPTTPITAPPNPPAGEDGSKRPDGTRNDDVFDLHRLTEAPSHAGLPAITVPCGFSPRGLPIGLQVIAPMFEDGLGIYVASRYEQSTDWHRHRPVVLDSTSAAVTP